MINCCFKYVSVRQVVWEVILSLADELMRCKNKIHLVQYFMTSINWYKRVAAIKERYNFVVVFVTKLFSHYKFCMVIE